MPSLIPVHLYRDELAPLLGPGEQPLVAEGVQSSLGVDHIDQTTQERFAALPAPLRDALDAAMRGGDPERARSMLERAIDVTVFPVLDVDPILGVAGRGAVGSIAHAFKNGLDRATTGFLLITDRRLLLAEQHTSAAWQRLVAVNREVIVDARSKPHLLQRGRLILDFADDSQISFLTGVLFSGAARRLAAALGAPGAARGRL